MPIYEFSDGSRYELDLSNPEHRAWMERKAAELETLGKAQKKETAKSAVGFLGQTARDVAKGAASYINEGTKVHPFFAPSQLALKKAGVDTGKAVEAISPARPDETPAEARFRKVAEGVGAGMVSPLPLVGALTGGMAALGADMGESLGKRAFGEKGAAPGAIAGGLLLGAPTGFLLGPKLNVAQQDMSKAAKMATPEDWRNAQKALAAARDVGADDFMLPDAFPPKHPIQIAAAEAATKTLDNPIRVKLSNRLGTPERPPSGAKLANEAISRLTGKPADALNPDDVANHVSTAANAHVKAVKEAATTGFSNRLAGRALHPRQMRDIHDQIAARAASLPPEHPQRKVLEELKNIFTPEQSKGTILDLKQQINAYKDNLLNPMTASTARKADAATVSSAVRFVEDLLGSKSKAFSEAMDDFAAYQDRVVAPLRSGPIGQLADANINAPDMPTPVGRLQSIVGPGASPREAAHVGRVLSNPVEVGQHKVSPEEIAAAIIRAKTATAPVNPGQAVRGAPGSPVDQNLRALISAGKADPQQALKPLTVGDWMSSMQAPGILKDLPEMQISQLFIRPLRTLDMMMTQRTEATAANEIARLLAQNDPQALAALQRLAMFDPNVRRMLSLGLPTVVATQQQAKE